VQRADEARSADRLPLIASGLFVVACAVAYGGLLSHAYPGDVGAYAGYGRALVLHGRIPYRDFYDEYPPGSVPVFALPALIWNAHYVLVFKLLMTACGVGFVLCAASIVRRLDLSALRLVPMVLAPVLLGPVFLNRYDPVPALLSSLALVALLAGRERSAGGLLGAGTAIKLYPAVFVPLAIRRVRSLTRAGAAYLITAAILVLPFFAIAPGGVGYSLKTQIERHLQIESLGSSILLAGSKLGIHHEGWIDGKPGSIDLGGGVAGAVGVASSVLAVVLVLVVAWAFWRGPDDDARQVTAWAAAAVAFVVFGKVLSPQYLTWLVPLVPLASGRKGRYAAIVFLGVLSLTQFEYLFHKHGLQNQDWTVWVLLIRNAGLVAVFALLLTQLLEPGHQQVGRGEPPTR
jgi:Glycosyltransferase family 87